MPILITSTYIALLLISFAIGLIVGMEKTVSTKEVIKFSFITALIFGLFSFAGIGIGNLFGKWDIKYMGALLVLAAGFTTVTKGGKSNAFIFSLDAHNTKYFVFANIAVGLSVMLATFGLNLFWQISLLYPALFFIIAFLFTMTGIWCGKKINTIKTIKIFLILSGIILFLVGLTMFILTWK
ncbi:hypothetical protein LJC30_01640 [Odoribacter sp. OttesenSCG-928-L07]|nr:hypothetical protein [Odoribacter sp. OttesenSCG-928-L07]MDL2239337.1 hypothetical protein [Bacteroidales bacterium OttesenSCG-928-L14]MDL2240382.1 hypothetical protein [Bacteroidales bacterium OttesenSCG-928-K22]